MKIAIGFKGERIVILPQAFLELMCDNPLTGDLYLSSIGYISNAMHHYQSSVSGTGEYLLIYCTIGRGSVEFESHRYEIKANQYIVVNANTPYMIQADDNAPWTIYWTTFRGVKAQIYASMMDRPVDIPPTTYSRIEQRIELFESIFSIISGELSIERLNYANILFSTFIASFAFVDVFRDSANKSGTQAQAMVNRVTRYMSENVEKTLTLKQLSQYAGYSESYFYRNFIKELGDSPIDYFIKMKINKASIYLIKTSMTISQISAKLGFSSPDYFSRTFRKVVGISASEFRKQDFRL